MADTSLDKDAETNLHKLGVSDTPDLYDDATADLTSSHIHDIDIDRRNQTNHASIFVLPSGTPFGHLLWHLYWFNSSVEVLGYGATDLTNSQVREYIGCIEQCGKVQPRFLNYRGLQF